MQRIAFDSEKYLILQSAKIMERVARLVAAFTAGGGDVADTYEIKVTQNAVASNQLELFRIAANGTISQIAQSLPETANVPNITYGTANPSGGSNGDIYFKIEV